MKLSLLHETVTTAAIAVGPGGVGPGGSFGKSTRKKKRKYFGQAQEAESLDLSEDSQGSAGGYLGGVSPRDQPVNQMTTVWTTFKSPKGKDRWEQKYAATNNPDERLLKQYRGKGY